MPRPNRLWCLACMVHFSASLSLKMHNTLGEMKPLPFFKSSLVNNVQHQLQISVCSFSLTVTIPVLNDCHQRSLALIQRYQDRTTLIWCVYYWY